MLHTANHSSSSLHWCVVKAVFLTTFFFCKISTNAAYGWKPAHIYLYFCGITCSLNHLLFYNNIPENIIIANHISPGKLSGVFYHMQMKYFNVGHNECYTSKWIPPGSCWVSFPDLRFHHRKCTRVRTHMLPLFLIPQVQPEASPCSSSTCLQLFECNSLLL